MAISSVLGQVNPATTTATTLYTVPEGYTATVTGVTVATSSASTARKVRLAIRPGGETLALRHYALYDYTVAVNAATVFDVEWPLGSGDVVTVYADASDLAFTLFGREDKV
jgi:hypothetical protein